MSALGWTLASVAALFVLARIGVEWHPAEEPSWSWLPWLGSVTW